MSSKVAAAGSAGSKNSSRPQKSSAGQQSQRSNSSQRSQRSSSAAKSKKSSSVKRADSQRFQKTSRSKQAQKPSKLPAAQQKNLKNIGNAQTKQLSNNHTKTTAADKSNKNTKTAFTQAKDTQAANAANKTNPLAQANKVDAGVKATQNTNNIADTVRGQRITPNNDAGNTPPAGNAAQGTNTNNGGDFWDNFFNVGPALDANGLPAIGLRGGDETAAPAAKGPTATAETIRGQRITPDNNGGNTPPAGNAGNTGNPAQGANTNNGGDFWDNFLNVGPAYDANGLPTVALRDDGNAGGANPTGGNTQPVGNAAAPTKPQFNANVNANPVPLGSQGAQEHFNPATNLLNNPNTIYDQTNHLDENGQSFFFADNAGAGLLPQAGVNANPVALGSQGVQEHFKPTSSLNYPNVSVYNGPDAYDQTYALDGNGDTLV